MLSLVIDSAIKNMYIGLVEDEKIIYEKYYNGANDHAKNIVSGINEALNFVNLKIDDLKKIICGIGPGSYTGVRMAVTVSKMLASLKKIPLYKISTLLLMASNFNGKTLSYIDARNGNVFGGIYEDGKILKEEFILLEELKKEEYSNIVDSNNFKVNPVNVIKYASLVEEPLLLVPNYLRDTEAERNYDKNHR